MSKIKNSFLTYKTFSFLLALVAFLYFSSIFSGFYWKNPWVDIPLHFLGGLSVALFGIIYFKNEIEKLNLLSAVVFILGFSGLIGIFWEFFEWGLDTFFKAKINQASVSDTLGDLLMDLLGSILIVFYFLFLRKKAKN